MKKITELFPLALLTFAFSCGGGSAEIDDDDDDTLGVEDQYVNPDAPVISGADAWCYLHDTGNETYIWKVSLSATDEQGNDTIESFFEGVTVYDDGGNELFTEHLVCGGGECSGTWNEGTYSMYCSSASSYTIEIEVTDEDGNISAPVEVQGRQGGSAAG